SHFTAPVLSLPSQFCVPGCPTGHYGHPIMAGQKTIIVQKKVLVGRVACTICVCYSGEQLYERWLCAQSRSFGAERSFIAAGPISPPEPGKRTPADQGQQTGILVFCNRYGGIGTP